MRTVASLKPWRRNPRKISDKDLAAAEKHDRKAYLMEIDPRYCDVIVKWWMALTGEKPKLARMVPS